MRTFEWAELAPNERAQLIQRPALAEDAALQSRTVEIIADVRKRGDRALVELGATLDKVELTALKVEPEEFERAGRQLNAAQKAAIGAARDNIRRFHEAQLAHPLRVETASGVVCERVTRPIARVGLYVPAGSAPLPSTALMLAVPANIAQCRERILCSPPQADGSVHPTVLFVAQACGVSDVFRIGGAQAIAAMAYGTETVPKVDKIFGPGNAWVTAAKAQVAQDPLGAARDMPAGPSEVLVIADDTADPRFVAADLLSQAEHGPDSQSVLVSTSQALIDATIASVDEQRSNLSRRDVIARSIEHAFAVRVTDLATAFEVSNRYAPEHLILQITSPRDWLDDIQAAGSVFLGPWTPESVGDYCSGTNHVLPTYGFARSYSSLGVADFMRSMTIQELTPEGLREIGPIAMQLADLEGLDAHSEAVRLRLAAMPGDSA
jgi:histidinol dehydrogenase